jgi:Pentapeptide repeats (8 copies)
MNRNGDAASSWKRLGNVLLVPAGILCLALLLWFALRHGLRTGFRAERIQLGEHEHYVPAKTLWDWLQLFGAPFVLAVIAYFFQRATKTADQKLAIESQRHSILQAYFDSMSQLLASEEWERDVRAFRRYGMKDGRGVLQQMVRARTLMLLETLNTDPPDQKRRGQIIRFLRETRLIQAGHLGTPALIDLSGADLRGVSLEGADLSQADLRGVDLRGADLRWANLKDIEEDIISPDARYRQPTVTTCMRSKAHAIRYHYQT